MRVLLFPFYGKVLFEACSGLSVCQRLHSWCNVKSNFKVGSWMPVCALYPILCSLSWEECPRRVNKKQAPPPPPACWPNPILCRSRHKHLEKGFHLQGKSWGGSCWVRTGASVQPHVWLLWALAISSPGSAQVQQQAVPDIFQSQQACQFVIVQTNRV